MEKIEKPEKKEHSKNCQVNGPMYQLCNYYCSCGADKHNAIIDKFESYNKSREVSVEDLASIIFDNSAGNELACVINAEYVAKAIHKRIYGEGKV